MPNGRSGGFRITVEQFRQLLAGLPGSARIAGHRLEEQSVSELGELLDRHSGHDAMVEEQDHSWYIAHLGSPPTGWVVVDEASPLYAGFRQCHAEWLRRQYKDWPSP